MLHGSHCYEHRIHFFLIGEHKYDTEFILISFQLSYFNICQCLVASFSRYCEKH